MPKKKSAVKSNKRAVSSNKSAAKPSSKMNPTLVAIGVIAVIVVVAVILVILINNRPTQSSTPQDSAQVPALVGTKQYASSPPMTIDKTKQYTATVKMAKGGQFVIQLYPDKAPIAVNNFVFLARQGYFNGTTFHRVLENFMAQGGDPTGTGSGGPGYKFVNEDSDLKFDKAGVVAMANSGRDTNGSQFFITFVPVANLNGGYTIFGQVTSGMDVVNGIKRRDPNQNPTYQGDAIDSITISEQ